MVFRPAVGNRFVLALLLVLTSTITHAQRNVPDASNQPTAGAQPDGPGEIRSLASFRYLHVPTVAAQVGDPTTMTQTWRLTRDFREALIQEMRPRDRSGSPFPLPFYWRLIDSVPAGLQSSTLIATRRPDTTRRGDVVVEFTDYWSRPIGVIRSSTVDGIMRTLTRLSYATTTNLAAEAQTRLIGSFGSLQISTTETREEDVLARATIVSELRRRGVWSAVESQSTVADENRRDVAMCSTWEVSGSLPTMVGLRCRGPNGGFVVELFGRSCRGCLGGEFVFSSTRTRTIDAAKDVVKQLMDHHELEDRVYAPQLIGGRPKSD